MWTSSWARTYQNSARYQSHSPACMDRCLTCMCRVGLLTRRWGKWVMSRSVKWSVAVSWSLCPMEFCLIKTLRTVLWFRTWPIPTPISAWTGLPSSPSTARTFTASRSSVLTHSHRQKSAWFWWRHASSTWLWSRRTKTTDLFTQWRSSAPQS